MITDAFYSYDECNNSVETGLRSPDDFDSNQSVESDFSVSESSTAWNGKENLAKNADDKKKAELCNVDPMAPHFLQPENDSYLAHAVASHHKVMSGEEANRWKNRTTMSDRLHRPSESLGVGISGPKRSSSPKDTKISHRSQIVTIQRPRLHKMDVQEIFRRQHEQCCKKNLARDNTSRGTAVKTWRQSVERAALLSHRSLPRSQSGKYM